ncbi:MAG: amidohydrolase family protein, partial [Dehalococcoidia bacterium]
MLDLLIRGGTVVTPSGVGQWDVAVQGEQIVAVGAPESMPTEAARVLDATGRVVIPGGVEPHAHVSFPVPTQPPTETASPPEVTRAAVFGGTTTVVDFAEQMPGSDIFQAIEDKNARWQGNAYTDYSYHCMLRGELPYGELPLSVIAQVKDAIAQGFPSFKVFTTFVRPRSNRPYMVDLGSILAVMEQVAAHGGIMAVHAEDDDIVQFMYRKLMAEGKREWYHLHLVHNNLSEELSFRRVIRLAERTGAAVYFVHVSAREGVQAIAEARGRGLPIYGETLHNYLAFTAEDYKRGPDGMKYHTYPSLKSKKDQDALWEGISQGQLSTLATDEYTTSYEIKTRGKSLPEVTGGHNGIETRVGILYTEGVVKRGMSLQRFAELVATSPARILGLYPRKGVIAPGSDADLTLIDPTIHKQLSLEDLHHSDYSIWEGWEVWGWPVTTILRGQVVVQDGQLLAQPRPGRGQL